MRGVRNTPDGIRVVEVPDPDPQDGEVVTIRAAGICGSDFDYIEMGVRKTLGHELAGHTSDGRAVAVEGIFGCGACARCARGEYNRCSAAQTRALGFGRDGGMADSLAVPAAHLVPLPDGLPPANASLVEPMAVALHGLRLAQVEPGQRIGVIGGGSVGLLAAAAARAAGHEVTVAARHPVQIEAAERLGAGSSRRAGSCDVVIEAAGNESALVDAIDWLEPGGTLVVLGVYGGGIPLPMTAFLKEATVRSSLAYCRHGAGREVDEAADLLARNPAIAEALITHRFPLDDAAHAFAVASDRKSGAIKVVLEP